MRRCSTRLTAVLVLALAGCPAERAPSTEHAQRGDAAVFAPPDAGNPVLTDAGRDTGANATDASVNPGDGCPGFEPPLNDRPDLFDGPALLSETGLYTDIANGVLAPEVREYEPKGELWSDGATKRRWLKLPAGAVIDTSDMDDWVFPVGTMAFKEFARDGKRIETRLVWKRGEGDFPMVAYLWNAEQTEAFAAPNGRDNACGTAHDVPDASKCPTCHVGRSDRLLGTTALQLSHAKPGLTIDALIAQGALSVPPAAPLQLPGDAAVQDALAYLHANCGHCHNPEAPNADRFISVYFWQRSDSLATLQDTVTYQSLVTDKGNPLWIDAVLDRMGNRSDKRQMPPLATEEVDADGLAKVSALMSLLRADVSPLAPPASAGTCPDVAPLFEIFGKMEGFSPTCGSGFCHGGNSGYFYYATPEDLYAELVATPADPMGLCSTSGLSRVEPGDPMRSLLYLKLLPGPPCGGVMPNDHALSDADIQAVADWIESCTPTP